MLGQQAQTMGRWAFNYRSCVRKCSQWRHSRWKYLTESAIDWPIFWVHIIVSGTVVEFRYITFLCTYVPQLRLNCVRWHCLVVRLMKVSRRRKCQWSTPFIASALKNKQTRMADKSVRGSVTTIPTRHNVRTARAGFNGTPPTRITTARAWNVDSDLEMRAGRSRSWSITSGHAKCASPSHSVRVTSWRFVFNRRKRSVTLQLRW